MLMSQRYCCRVPFPLSPNSIKEKYLNSGLSLRAFGSFEDDLDIYFNQKAHPHFVTQILQCCTVDKNGDRPDKTFFWDLTVGKRIECLLTIATLGGSSELLVHICCSSESCQQQMELELSVEELANLQRRTGDTDSFTIPVGGGNLLVRKPTGNDQLQWLKHPLADEQSAVGAMVRSLVVDNKEVLTNQESHMPDDWIETINETMDEFDPLVNFSVSVQCPCCGNKGSYEIDLEELSLQKLHKAQQHLLETVHRLASYYHWSEQQIFSLPLWRRFHYLTLIEKEENR